MNAQSDKKLADVLADAMGRWPRNVTAIRQYATGALHATKKPWPVILTHIDAPVASDWLTASVTKSEWGKACERKAKKRAARPQGEK